MTPPLQDSASMAKQSAEANNGAFTVISLDVHGI
jgi:hypothetical protein